VVEAGRPDFPTCQFGSEPFTGGIGVGSSSTEDGSSAYGSTAEPTAAVAVITLGTGEMVRIPIVRPGGPVANDHGYFMAKFDAGTEIDLIVMVDASGAELESYPFRR
jgi:hypothetical protein